MRKRILVLFITAIYLFGITACGSSKHKDASGGTDIQVTDSSNQNVEPTEIPIVEATLVPTQEPTETPVVESTPVPTEEPTEAPIVEATPVPTEKPKAEPILEVAPEHEVYFGLVSSCKSANGIEYTYQDYLNDLEKRREWDEAHAKVIVADIEDLEANKEAIAQTIIRNIARYNRYIYDHCGYPESKYGDGPHSQEANPDIRFLSLYIGVMNYMDRLVEYAGGDEEEAHLIKSQEEYFGITVDRQVEGLRGAMFYGIPYEQDDSFPIKNYLLVNFLKDGHPDITSVENLTVEKVNEIMDFDGHQVGVIATFTCGGDNYTCWIEATAGSIEGAYYTVLDLKKN